MFASIIVYRSPWAKKRPLLLLLVSFFAVDFPSFGSSPFFLCSPVCQSSTSYELVAPCLLLFPFAQCRAPQILGTRGCVYIKFCFYKFGVLNFFFRSLLIFFKKFEGLWQLFHLAWFMVVPDPVFYGVSDLKVWWSLMVTLIPLCVKGFLL